MKRTRFVLIQLVVLAALAAHAAPARAQADLVLTNFNAQVSGTTVTYHATICNLSTTDVTGNFSLGFFFHHTTKPNCTTTPSQTVTVSGLAGGNCSIHSITRTNTPAGSYTGWALADASCVVTESIENNNAASYKYNVALPDLEVSNFSASASGSTVTFYATVCNYGPSTTQSFALELYYNRTGEPGCNTAHSQTVTITGLAQANCTVKTFTRTNTPAGNYTAWARADANCVVNESNETNNNRSYGYVVGQPDLTVSEFDISVSYNTVTFDVTVCNLGEGTTANFALEIYHHRTTAPGCSTTHSQTYNIGGMGSAACNSYTFYRNNTPLGSYTGWARVDANCVVTEGVESNNNDSDTYSVTSLPPGFRRA